MQPLELVVDDIVQLRKKHPCGSDRWQVYRVGADIGLRCQGCGRRVMLPRSQLKRRIKAVLRPDAEPPKKGETE
jgi:hypothetical protein